MVHLEVVEDEAFVEKPQSSKDDALLVDDDADYTDTGMRHLYTAQSSSVGVRRGSSY